MTASARCIDRIYRYYTDFIIGKQDMPFREGDITHQRSGSGSSNPSEINVIPLFEDRDQCSTRTDMVERVPVRQAGHHRPAGLPGPVGPGDELRAGGGGAPQQDRPDASLGLSKDTGVALFPIIGVGSAPFRGNLAPHTVERVIEEYPSAHTFTIQSSFKYDHPPQAVVEAIRTLRDRKTGSPMPVDEKRCLCRHRPVLGPLLRAGSSGLAPIINEAAAHVPERRKRKLHIGLFGYSRETAGIKLPRAIRFTAALYSIGIPPELLALSALTKEDMALLREFYIHLDDDIRDALRYFNPESPFVPEGVSAFLGPYAGDVSPDPEHKELTDRIAGHLKAGKTGNIAEHVLAAANVRGFLG